MRMFFTIWHNITSQYTTKIVTMPPKFWEADKPHVWVYNSPRGKFMTHEGSHNSNKRRIPRDSLADKKWSKSPLLLLWAHRYWLLTNFIRLHRNRRLHRLIQYIPRPHLWGNIGS